MVLTVYFAGEMFFQLDDKHYGVSKANPASLCVFN